MPVDSGSFTPESIARRRKLAEALRAQGMSQQNIEHPMQGVAQLAQAFIGGQESRRLDEAEREGRTGANQLLADLLKNSPEGETASERSRRLAAELQGNPWTEGLGQQLAVHSLTEGPEKLVAVMGDEGPQYVPQSQAVGRQPFSGSTGAKPPASIAEYNLAKEQGYGGTFQDWQNERSRGQVIEFEGAKYIFNPVTKEYSPLSTPQGEIGAAAELELFKKEAAQGRMWDPETGEFKPVAGSAAARDEQAEAEAEAARREGEVNTANIITQDIDRALDKMNEGVLPDTGWGAMFANVPGTDARQIRGLLDTVKANIGFDELQQMREASPTGGALGQVSEREIAFLQALAGNLEQSQDKQQLTDNLNRLWNAMQDTIHGPEAGPPRRPLSFEGGGEAGAGDDADLEALLQKYGA